MGVFDTVVELNTISCGIHGSAAVNLVPCAHFGDLADLAADCVRFLRTGKQILSDKGSFALVALPFLVVACACRLEIIFELLDSRLLEVGSTFSVSTTGGTGTTGARRRPRDSSST